MIYLAKDCCSFILLRFFNGIAHDIYAEVIFMLNIYAEVIFMLKSYFTISLETTPFSKIGISKAFTKHYTITYGIFEG